MSAESTPVQDTPLLSVITICKDHPDGFLKTMDSMRAQFEHVDRKAIEWIVVNGSTQSSAVADMIEANRDIVTWNQSKADKGIYHAMNIGIDQSRGKYMQFMNAGDGFANPWTVAQMKDALEENPDCDFLYGDYYKNDKLLYAQNVDFLKRGMPTSHQAMIFNRECVGDQRHDTSLRLAADYQFIVDYSKKMTSPLRVGFAVARSESGGLTETQYTQSALETYKVRKNYGGITPMRNYLSTAVTITKGILKNNAPVLYDIAHILYRAVKPMPQSREPAKLSGEMTMY